MMEELLTIQNISKHFDGVKAVDNVCLAISPHTITGLYGENGAGKTTLFNLISGFEIPDTGSILLDRKDITRKSVLYRAQMGMGRLFQNPRIFQEVTVFDNLLASSKHFAGHNLYNYFLKNRLVNEQETANRQKAAEILDQFSMSSKSGLKAYELSVGERKLLSLGSLLMNGVQFILLDELTSGLNNNMIGRLNNVLQDLNKSGLTFLMIEHNREVMQQLCGQFFEMQNGKLLKV